MPRKTETRQRTRAHALSGELDDLIGSSVAQANIDDVEDEDDVFEMLNMLTEIKRKTTKSSSSSAFQTRKNALFSAARKDTQVAVRDGAAYIEQYLAALAQMKAQEVSLDEHAAYLTQLKGRDEVIETLQDLFTPMLEDLAHRRARSINETSAMLEAHSTQRVRSRMWLINRAKARIDEDTENQRVATDATALIKHYKALLLS